jgi:hypothetical protein
MRLWPVNLWADARKEMAKILLSQQFIITSLVFFLAAGSFTGLSIKGKKPRESLQTSLLPTIPLIFISGGVAFFAFLAMLAELRAGWAPL